MHTLYRVLNLVFVLLILFTGFAVVSAQEHGEIHWSYKGEEAPEHWGELNEEWEACSLGNAQSPIDIADATPLDLNDIEVNYDETPLTILNNGHTIQVNYTGESSIVYNEIEYKLLQFHFHHPSEHTIAGEAAPMEIHLVHVSENGNLAVIGVMLMAGEEVNTAYASVFDYLPADESEPETVEGMMVNAADLLPEDAAFYTYNGSLTTPPCTEIVRWLVMTEPVMLSKAQIEAFGAIFEHNARPVQPLNDRDLFVDTGE